MWFPMWFQCGFQCGFPYGFNVVSHVVSMWFPMGFQCGFPYGFNVVSMVSTRLPVGSLRVPMRVGAFEEDFGKEKQFEHSATPFPV